MMSAFKKVAIPVLVHGRRFVWQNWMRLVLWLPTKTESPAYLVGRERPISS